MYLAFHGLHERPFTQTPDPRFLYWNEGYREALASLRYGIQQRKGFVALIGEAGTGKTTLLRKLLDDLADEILSVFVFNPNASFEEILEYTLSELGISAPSGRKLAMTQRLNEFLLSAYAEGRNTVLIIDEAQDLSSEVLESLRLLSNLETAQDKILQIVLSGQPELATRLARPELRQLKQRISVRARLEPLSRAELAPYIAARLAVAGAPPDLFAPDSFDAIWSHCGGIPRLINTIGDNALLVAYALGRHSVDAEVISEVAADLAKLDAPGTPSRRASSPLVIESRGVAEEPRTASPPPRAEPATRPPEPPAEPKSSSPVPSPRSAPDPEASPPGPARVPPTRGGSAGSIDPGPPNPRLGLAVAGVLATALLLFATVLLQRPDTPPAMESPSPFAEHRGGPAAADPVPAGGAGLSIPPPRAAVLEPPPRPVSPPMGSRDPSNPNAPPSRAAREVTPGSAKDPGEITSPRGKPSPRGTASSEASPKSGPQPGTATTSSGLAKADSATRPTQANQTVGEAPAGHGTGEDLPGIRPVAVPDGSDHRTNTGPQARSVSAAATLESAALTDSAVASPSMDVATARPTAVGDKDSVLPETPQQSPGYTDGSAGERSTQEGLAVPEPQAGSTAGPLRSPADPELATGSGHVSSAPEPRAGDRSITLRQGDTLLDLVGREYGEMNYTALEILRARNPQAMRPEHMIAGTPFVIPAPGATSRMIGQPESPKVLALATPILARAMAEQAKLAREYGDRVRLETSEVGAALSVYRVVITNLEPRTAESLSRRLGPVLAGTTTGKPPSPGPSPGE